MSDFLASRPIKDTYIKQPNKVLLCSFLGIDVRGCQEKRSPSATKDSKKVRTEPVETCKKKDRIFTNRYSTFLDFPNTDISELCRGGSRISGKGVHMYT